MTQESPDQKVAQEQESKEDWFDKAINTWWGKFVFSLGMGVFSWWLYSDFAALESGKMESMELWAPAAFLYEIGGKWGGISIFVLLAVGAAAWGIKQLVSGKE